MGIVLSIFAWLIVTKIVWEATPTFGWFLMIMLAVVSVATVYVWCKTLAAAFGGGND